MDIRSLACFVAVAEELHFHRAAARLATTQPALSQRIKRLEEEVGTALFERDRRHVALTAAGAAFLEPARTAVASAEVARGRALRAARGEIGRVRLGFTVIAFYGPLPAAVRRFRADHPEVAVELAEMNSPALEAALTTGAVDLAVLHPPLSAPDLVVSDLPAIPLVLALPEAHRLAAQCQVAVADLADEPLMIAPRSVGPVLYDRFLTLFRAAGFSPRIAQEVTPMTSLVGLVAAGAGAGFVSAGIAAVGRPGVVFRPVEPEPPRLPLAVAWRGPALSPVAERLLRAVEACAGM